MNAAKEKARIRWACRRGMLELDVLFLPFLDEAYDHLSDQDKALFERLLECDDPDLFAWIMGHQHCSDPDLKYMVDTIVNRVRV